MFGRNRPEEELIYADPLAGEKPMKAGRRGLGIIAAVLLAAGLLILAAAALNITTQGMGQRYQNALYLLEQKQYAAAAAELESLDGFRDSAALLAELRADGQSYAAARALVDQQRYDEAIAAFLALGDYADSSIWAACGVTYCHALDLMKQNTSMERALAENADVIGSWETAAAMLEHLGDYEDAREKADTCYAAAAELKLEVGDLEGVMAYLEKMTPEAAGEFRQKFLNTVP